MLRSILLLTAVAASEAFQAPCLAPAGRRAAAISTPRALSSLRMQKVDDKTEVREYFNSEGFNRWSKIYSDSEDVNSVQKYIRSGHQETVDKVLAWIDEDQTAAAGQTFCDAGCGVGSLAIPLAERGAKVSASDISSAMANEAATRASSMDLKGSATFETADLESLDGPSQSQTSETCKPHFQKMIPKTQYQIGML
mmetsp:Transcript_17876/g.27640  ORF Transcript_17876/g.27640 Transcript_17876/m.27640 type:complete len:196 (-) Transcript_17876:789-1376(-)